MNNETAQRKHSPKKTFNNDPALYNQIRPAYPEALVEDVVEICGLKHTSRILDVGCGTGQASKPFIEKGYKLTGIDLGEDMIAYAQTKFREQQNAEFIRAEFEKWNGKEKFDLIISATAFHWIDPEIGYKKAASLLKNNGYLAIYSNRHINKERGFFKESQAVYNKYYSPIAKEYRNSANLYREKYFKLAYERNYQWNIEYQAKEYLDLLNTYSDHISLPDQNRILLFEGIEKLIQERYEGRVLKEYESVLKILEKV